MSEVIVFTSGKGGVGKSNLCLNTVLQLTALQYRSCLFDGDLGLANVNILLGIDQEYTLDDVVFNDKKIDEILVQTGYGFDIIPGSSGVEQIADLTADQLHTLITALTSVDDYDYFLIDTASGISRSVISFCMAARQTIIVITREATSLTDAYALLKILSVNGYQGLVRVLINDCESIPQAKSTYLRYKKVVDKHLDIQITPAGIVLHDDHFERAVVQQKPLLELYPDSIGAQCIRAFVSNLVGEKGPGPGGEGLSEFWQRYLEQITENGSPGRPGEESAGSSSEKAPLSVNDSIQLSQLPFDQPGTPRPGDVAAAMFRAEAFPDIGFSASAFLAPIFKRLNQGEISAAELRQLIIVDPGLMVQALRLLNLEEIAPQGHIDSLEEVTGCLNDEDFQPMLLKAALRSGEEAGQDAEGGGSLTRWIESYRCAVLAREIGQAVSFGFPDEAYLGGLLLDIAHSETEGGEGQQETVDHAELGADLLQSLGLNPMICDAVRFHHHPPSQVSTAFNLVRIVFAAHSLVYGAEPGEALSETIDFPDGLIDLSKEEALELLAKANEITARTAAWLDLDVSPNSTIEAASETNGSLYGYLLDNLLTRTIMSPLSRPSTLEGWVRNFHRSCTLLTGIRRLICLVADESEEHLAAIGFEGCFCAEYLDNIVIPVDSSTSLVSKVYTTGIPLMGDLHQESTLNLGDRQLGSLLGGRKMICIPLKSGGKSTALVVYSPDDGQAATVDRQMSTLLTLGTRAAEDLDTLRAGNP
ncbi:MAG: HDOD domain-containing protein [Desulfocapsaceae bacterium]